MTSAALVPTIVQVMATRTSAEPELSTGLASASFERAVAPSVAGPSVHGITTMSTVRESPAARSPRSQDTVPAACVHVPVDGVADANCMPGGSTSESVTPVAPAVPTLVTVKVNDSGWEMFAGFGEA